MLDSHFSLGQTRFLVAGEPDQTAGLCRLLTRCGRESHRRHLPGRFPATENFPAEKILVGDLGDAETLCGEFDLLITNVHGEALAHRCHKGLLLRGYPIWEQIGNQLKNDVLYEGGAYFLSEVANAASKRH